MKRAQAGVTLIEAMAAMVVLSFGLLGVTYLVMQSSRQNRVNYSQQQAYVLAEQELERILAMGCRVTSPPGAPVVCQDLVNLDRTSREVWWSANGEASESDPGDASVRKYLVQVDVDPPAEGGELGSPPLPPPGSASTIYNIRVAVSWDDSGRPKQVVALQTRVSP